MNRSVALASPLLVLLSAPIHAQGPGDRSVTAYDRCLTDAAIRVSYTSTRDQDVFDVARRRCAGARAALARAPDQLAAIDAADATSAIHFPEWIARMRERRQLRAIGLPIPADPGFR